MPLSSLGLEVERLLRLGIDLLCHSYQPVGGRRHDATALLEGLAIGRRHANPVCSRVDRVVGPLTELVGFQPERHQAPAGHHQLAPIARGFFEQAEKSRAQRSGWRAGCCDECAWQGAR
jgi:hypothetical protein